MGTISGLYSVRGLFRWRRFYFEKVSMYQLFPKVILELCLSCVVYRSTPSQLMKLLLHLMGWLSVRSSTVRITMRWKTCPLWAVPGQNADELQDGVHRVYRWFPTQAPELSSHRASYAGGPRPAPKCLHSTSWRCPPVVDHFAEGQTWIRNQKNEEGPFMLHLAPNINYFHCSKPRRPGAYFGPFHFRSLKRRTLVPWCAVFCQRSCFKLRSTPSRALVCLSFGSLDSSY